MFVMIQAIGGGGQGWANAILYVLLSPKIRKRLYASICPSRCVTCVLPCKLKEQSEIVSTTHFSPSHEPVETDQLIKNWEVL